MVQALTGHRRCGEATCPTGPRVVVGAACRGICGGTGRGLLGGSESDTAARRPSRGLSVGHELAVA